MTTITHWQAVRQTAAASLSFVPVWCRPLTTINSGHDIAGASQLCDLDSSADRFACMGPGDTGRMDQIAVAARMFNVG